MASQSWLYLPSPLLSLCVRVCIFGQIVMLWWSQSSSPSSITCTYFLAFCTDLCWLLVSLCTSSMMRCWAVQASICGGLFNIHGMQFRWGVPTTRYNVLRIAHTCIAELIEFCEWWKRLRKKMSRFVSSIASRSACSRGSHTSHMCEGKYRGKTEIGWNYHSG